MRKISKSWAVAAVFASALTVFSSSQPEAEAADLSHLVVNQWVRHNPADALEGSILMPQANGMAKRVTVANVAMVGEDGQIRRSKTNAEGLFSFADVKPGIYALTARGKDVFSIVALHVVDASSPDAIAYPETAEIPAAKLDYTAINSAIVRYLPPKDAPVSPFSMRTAKLGELADQVVGKEMFRVSQVDGGMTGQIYTAGAEGSVLPVASRTNVFVTKDGEEVARTITDEQGRFTIEHLELGQYSVLAVGQGGLGLVGFELVNGNVSASVTASANSANAGQTLVSQADCGCSNSFAMQVAPMPEVVECVQCVATEQIVSEEIISEEVISEEIVGCDGGCGDPFGSPVPGGGYYGGGYGGGGGGYGGGGGGGLAGGGGGGLLGLAAVGGIAAAAIASADNNNNGNGFFGPLPGIATPPGL